MNAKMLEKANDFIKTREDACFSVIDENGYPSASAIWLIDQENIMEIYFSTIVSSNKYKRLQKSKKASICCYSEFNNLTLVGEAEVLTDQESKSKHWQEPFIHIYPEGETDPAYCIIKFITKRVSLHIDHEGAEFALDQPENFLQRYSAVYDEINSGLNKKSSEEAKKKSSS